MFWITTGHGITRTLKYNKKTLNKMISFSFFFNQDHLVYKQPVNLIFDNVNKK